MRTSLVVLALAACSPEDATTFRHRALRVVVRDGGLTVTNGDAGWERDAGVVAAVVDGGELDAGLVFDPEPTCPAECVCRVVLDPPSGFGGHILGYQFPCCATLCLSGSAEAYQCDQAGVLHRLAASSVCWKP